MRTYILYILCLKSSFEFFIKTKKSFTRKFFNGAPNQEYFAHLISIIKNTPNDKLEVWKPILSGFLDTNKSVCILGDGKKVSM